MASDCSFGGSHERMVEILLWSRREPLVLIKTAQALGMVSEFPAEPCNARMSSRILLSLARARDPIGQVSTRLSHTTALVTDFTLPHFAVSPTPLITAKCYLIRRRNKHTSQPA